MRVRKIRPKAASAAAIVSRFVKVSDLVQDEIGVWVIPIDSIWIETMQNCLGPATV